MTSWGLEKIFMARAFWGHYTASKIQENGMGNDLGEQTEGRETEA